MQHKFSYGDLVIGNSFANDYYGTTTKGTKWIVIKANLQIIHIISEEGWAKLQQSKKYYPFTNRIPHEYFEFDVLARCFDYVKSTIDKSNKAMSHVLQKYDD